MLFFVVILINFNYIRKIIKSSLGATEGLVQQGFCVMAVLVQVSSLVFQLNFSTKLKVLASKSATTQSPGTLGKRRKAPLPNRRALRPTRRLTKSNDIVKRAPVVPHCKKPTAQTAHLVFADTQANPKNQKSCFLPTLDRKNL